jgi:F-type H+-transporting ATPase subunit epsilon
MTNDKVRVVVVTPEKSVLDEAAEYAVLPLYDGEIGVQPGHAAFVGQLGPGELRIVSGGGVTAKRYFVDGGFAQVRADVINVLTPKAVPAAEVTAAKAEAAMTEANAMPVGDATQRANREKAQARAMAMARLAAKG